jgi:predicted RNase H-like nuclease (RuvC/YqgF family)
MDTMTRKDLVIERQQKDLQAQNDLIDKISERSQNIENENEELKKKKNNVRNELKFEKEVNFKLTKFEEIMLELDRLLVK